MPSHLFKVFIETLLERADHAERQLFMLSSHTRCKYTHTRHHGGYAPVSGWWGQSLDSSADDIFTDRLETLGNRVRGTETVWKWWWPSVNIKQNVDLIFKCRHCIVSSSLSRGASVFQVPADLGSSCIPAGNTTHHSSRSSHPHTEGMKNSLLSVSHRGLSGHMRTFSLGSGGWDGEEDWVQLRPTLDSPSWTHKERIEGRRGDGMRERQWYVMNVYFVFSAPKLLFVHWH